MMTWTSAYTSTTIEPVPSTCTTAVLAATSQLPTLAFDVAGFAAPGFQATRKLGGRHCSSGLLLPLSSVKLTRAALAPAGTPSATVRGCPPTRRPVGPPIALRVSSTRCAAG